MGVPRLFSPLCKVDAAFGQFIDDLKAKGKFDNSIVILTSDHGDWLGEYGRWGHGQSLLPPIIEVPLFIHLPSNLAKTMYCNPQQEVFLTDITPSIYYLLRHHDLRTGEFYGRPLFTKTADEQKDYSRPYHLFISSYTQSVAVMEESTKAFYAVDAADDNQSLYHLNDDWYGLDNVIDSESQKKFERITRDFVTRLNGLYGYSSKP
jgi:arylsulfatase A-like enzyme